jgi:acyl-CoA thioester hydrolase
MSHLADFPVRTEIPVLWGDQDLFAHVNNVVYFKWCETARVEYLKRIDLTAEGARGTGPIVASIKCDYRAPVNYPDTVLIGTRVTRIGNSSFRMEHRVVSVALETVVAEVDSTMVVYDYEEGKPVPMPATVRARIEQLEGRALD